MLKDWKKISNSKYVNKKRAGVLYIFDGKKVNISIDKIKIDGKYFTKTNIHEEFKSKAQALAYAKSYMRKN